MSPLKNIGISKSKQLLCPLVVVTFAYKRYLTVNGNHLSLNTSCFPGSPGSASVSSQSMPPVKVPSPINLSPARPKVSSPPAPSISPGNTSSAGGPVAITISTTNNNAQNLKKISPPTSFPANSSAPDASIPATSSLEKGKNKAILHVIHTLV